MYFKAVFACEDIADVADLTAGFCVERGKVDNDGAFVAFVQFIDLFVVFVEGEDFGFGLAFAITFKLGILTFVRQLGVGFEALCGACACALGFHFALEACFVQFDIAFAADVGSQVVWETVGIVEFEDDFAVEFFAAFSQRIFQQSHTGFQSLGKTAFFVF